MGDLVNKAADIIASKVSGPGMHRSERLKANHRLDQIEAARAIIAICQAEAADEIARLREALGMAKDLLDCIVQTPGNTWYVSADDPEAAVCDTYSAIDAVLQHKEPQG